MRQRSSKAKTVVGVLAISLVLGLFVGGAHAAPNWKTPAVYKSAANNGQYGSVTVDIRQAKRIRFKINTRHRGVRMDYSWSMFCVAGNGDIRTKNRDGRWNTRRNRRKLFEPVTPFRNRRYSQCSVSLYTNTVGTDPGRMVGRIQVVRK